MGTLQEVAEVINKTAREHGFYDKGERNDAEMLMLAVSELAEALEEHRDGRPLFWVESDFSFAMPEVDVNARIKAYLQDGEEEKPEGMAVEIADCIIRCLDHLLKLGITDIDGLLAAKMRYNEGRPYMHGKAY